ncbi:hypothetical protein ACFFX0_07170 [Citricoccus parietis]|uniref:Uncharacterized protein n=1 Tax=Citricoccus parietis TaxID=592307 RepID=A0ABV5FWB2_9MICC
MSSRCTSLARIPRSRRSNPDDGSPAHRGRWSSGPHPRPDGRALCRTRGRAAPAEWLCPPAPERPGRHLGPPAGC